ncbi:Transcriptional regulator, AraC family [Devosia sp. DBB001]|nr:Transcriptional regulator, AraC family [Devosia sp. DBB001]
MNRSGLDIEIERISSALSTSEWDFGATRQIATGRAFVLVSGAGEYAQERANSSIEAPCVLWIPTGFGGRVRLNAGARGIMMSVADGVLGRVVPASSVAGSLREAIDRPLLGVRVEPNGARSLMKDFEDLQAENDGDLPGRREAIVSRLSLILIAFWRLGSAGAKLPQASPRVLVQGFMQQVELHAREHWTIAAYANVLGITTDRLTTAIRRATGSSPLEIIHQRLLDDAEALLERSNLQVAEIADTLGFKDSGYFNRFFARAKGKPPGRFRKDVIEAKGMADISYSAWP